MIIHANPSLAIPFDCTATGIARCHGKCCTNLRSYWPVRVYQPKFCPYLTETGCLLTVKERPIDCLLYPLFINGRGTLVVHNRCYGRNWMCHENLRVGKPLIDSLKECLTELFGDQYQPMRRAILGGRPYEFRPSPEFVYCRMVEDLCIKYDLPIVSRTLIKEDFHDRGMKMLENMEEMVKNTGKKVSPHYREV